MWVVSSKIRHKELPLIFQQKIIKVNPNKFKNAVKRLAADSSGEEEQNWGYDEVGEAPKKISEDIEIINEDQMEIDEEVAGSKTDIAYPFSDDEYDEKYESRDEDDSVPIGTSLTIVFSI